MVLYLLIIFEGDLLYQHLVPTIEPTTGPVSQVGVSVVLSALTPE